MSKAQITQRIYVSPVQMNIETLYHESLLDFSDAVRGYERSCIRAQQRIRTLLMSDESMWNARLGRVKQLALTKCTSESDSKPESKLKELPPLHSIPLKSVNKSELSPATLNQSVERIVSIRLEVYKLSSDIPSTSKCWNQLVTEIEEIEARVLSVIVLPSNSLLEDTGSSTDQQLTFVVEQLEAQAKRCLDAAKQLAKTGSIQTKPTKHNNRKETAPVQPTETEKQTIPTTKRSQALVDHCTQLLYPLLSDYKLRKQTLCVKRMVGCACSQIIHSDPVHCLDRMNYLLTFLEGGPVKSTVSVAPATTTTAPTTNTQPAGFVSLSDLLPDNTGPIYAWQCLFSTALSQSEHQFAYNVDSAVTFAALLSGILARHPDKVPELLARLFLACPLLALCVDSQALAVLNVDKLCESSDSLPRLRGITRLFGALTVALPPPTIHAARAPHLNPALLWRTVAAIGNASWIPSVSAEVLHGLLEIGAPVLFSLYGNQAGRLLSTIVATIQSSSELAQSIPEISLLSSIESFQKSRSAGLAKTRLDSSFWKPVL